MNGVRPHRPSRAAFLASLAVAAGCRSTATQGSVEPSSRSVAQSSASAVTASPPPVESEAPGAALTGERFLGRWCVRRFSGKVWCWGSLPPFSNDTPRLPAMKPVQVPELTGATGLATSLAFDFFLKPDGSVWEWGIARAPGGKRVLLDRSTPRRVEGLSDILQIEGQSGLTALRRDGVVLEFQDEYTADEFDTTTGVTRTPAAEWPFSGVSSLAIPRGLCFIGAGSEVFCTWPHNGKLTPSRIPGLKAISVVKTCALTVERTVACWQEGKVGPKGMEYAPAKVIGALTDVRELSGVDGVRVFAVRNDGAVLSYSESDGGLRVWRGPERVKSLSVGLASLSSPHCVLYESGAVACWGKEKGRQLGTGTAFPSEDGTALPAVLKIGEDVSTAVGQ